MPPEIEARWREVLDAVREAEMPARVTTGIGYKNKTWLRTEMLVAPLGMNAEVAMLLMVFVAWSKSRL